MSEITSGTSGGWCGLSGVQLKLALAMLAGFVAVLALITIGNAESMITDFEAAHVPVTTRHIWIWQVTSVLAWAATVPAIWWAVARVRPPRFGWPMMAAVFVAGLFVASGVHIALMIAFRAAVYWGWEGARYHFQGNLQNPYVYEFRKDIATYLQFVLLALICQWLLARVGERTAVAAAPEARFLDISDGGATHRLPLSAITTVTAAGNYVEIAAEGRTLLHRATLAAMAEELGGGFARIHRSRLVNRALVRRIETNQAGDFELTLEDGTLLKGSRRYRAELG